MAEMSFTPLFESSLLVFSQEHFKILYTNLEGQFDNLQSSRQYFQRIDTA